MSKLTVRIEHDDLDNPCTEEGAWQLYSFCSRHVCFRHPDALNVAVERNRVIEVRDRTLKRKLKSGLAHWLGYFEHGSCAWFRSDDPPAGAEFEWDGVRYAGLLIWENKASDMGAKSYADRAKDADAFLKVFTSWANGEGLRYSIEDEEGDIIDSLGGFHGCDSGYMLDEMVPSLIGHEFRVKGVGTWLERELREKVVSRQTVSSN